MKRRILFAVPIILFVIGAAIAWAISYDKTASRLLVRGFIDMPEQATAPGTPDADVARLYATVDGTTTKFVYKDQAGTIRDFVDGEALGDDSIDDDAIDFADVTCADITMTDCGAVSGSSVTSSTDITATEDATGGNAGARSQIQGLPKIDLVSLGVMTDGTSGVTLTLMDDTPDGEFSEVDAGTNVVITADTTYYRVGAESLKIAFAATAVAGDGATDTNAIGDVEDEESLGFWCYSDTGLTAADMSVVLTDDGGARTYTFPVVAAGVWTWCEIDISALAGGTGDVISKIDFLLTSGGATNLGVSNVYLDGAWIWDADDEETLGRNIIQDGVLSVLAATNANTGTHEKTKLTEDTDYFIHYQTGNDAIVTITDQSANDAVALIAYQ